MLVQGDFKAIVRKISATSFACTKGQVDDPERQCTFVSDPLKFGS